MGLTNSSTSEMNNLSSFVFSVLCHSVQKDQEPGRRVRKHSLLLVLYRSSPQLMTESLCTALVLSLLPAVPEIIPSVPRGISGGACKWLNHTAGWWSERERGGKSSSGEKLQRVKLLTLNWALHLLLELCCHTGSLLQRHCRHSHATMSSCNFLHMEPSEPFLWPARDRFYCGASIDGSETWELGNSQKV